MSSSTNNWRERRTEHRLYAEIITDITNGTQNINTHNRTTQNTTNLSNTDTTIKPGVNSCEREW
jgi:hypothetical protein